MFCVECALVKQTLLEWFNSKFKSQYLQISLFNKFRYERNFPIDWQNDKCVICKFPLKVEPTNYQTPDDEMTFGDFIIRYEHKFLRNIYMKEQINYSSDIKDLQSYYKTFQKFIHISIGLISMLNHYNKNETVNYEVQEFIHNIFNDDSIDDFKNHIMKTDIKNALSTSNKKVPKFNLKIYTFVYDKSLYFPKSDIQYETFTTKKIFIHADRLIKVKVHLHYSHITGKIIGYSHDFCNTSVVEKPSPDIPVIVHNLFSFDLYYFIKGYIASAWCSKSLNIAGNNLTQINFSNIAGEIKFIDSLKFYQKSLAELASTLSVEEKLAVIELTTIF